jgi:hypothetical protein
MSTSYEIKANESFIHLRNNIKLNEYDSTNSLS